MEPVAPSILVFNRNKSNEMKKKVLFIDASDQLKVSRAQNYLDDNHVKQIFRWYDNFEDIDNYAKVVDVNEISENDYNLNIPLYVEKEIEDDLPTVEEALNDLKHAWEDVQSAEENFKNK